MGHKGRSPGVSLREMITLCSDSVCPICFNPLLVLLSEEETAVAMDSPAHPIEELGVTRLTCGHLFCRRECVLVCPFVVHITDGIFAVYLDGSGKGYG